MVITKQQNYIVYRLVNVLNFKNLFHYNFNHIILNIEIVEVFIGYIRSINFTLKIEIIHNHDQSI